MSVAQKALSVLGNNVFEQFCVFLLFLVLGGYICRLRGTSQGPGGLPGSILERFGGSFRSHWGSWGHLWGYIGASDGAFWCLFCCIYFRHVFGSKLLPELSQKGVPGHGIMQLKHNKKLCFLDMHMSWLKHVKSDARGPQRGHSGVLFGDVGDLWILFGAT